MKILIQCPIFNPSHIYHIDLQNAIICRTP